MSSAKPKVPEKAEHDVLHGATFALSDVSTVQLLGKLEDATGSFRIEVECERGSIALDIVHGQVLGARADDEHLGDATGADALTRYLAADRGVAVVHAQRFAQMANLLIPIRALVASDGARRQPSLADASRPGLPGAELAAATSPAAVALLDSASEGAPRSLPHPPAASSSIHRSAATPGLARRRPSRAPLHPLESTGEAEPSSPARTSRDGPEGSPHAVRERSRTGKRPCASSAPPGNGSLAADASGSSQPERAAPVPADVVPADIGPAGKGRLTPVRWAHVLAWGGLVGALGLLGAAVITLATRSPSTAQLSRRGTGVSIETTAPRESRVGEGTATSEAKATALTTAKPSPHASRQATAGPARHVNDRQSSGDAPQAAQHPSNDPAGASRGPGPANGASADRSSDARATRGHSASTSHSTGEGRQQVVERARELARQARDALAAGHSKRANRLADELVELRPGVAYYHWLAGAAKLELGDLAASRRAFERALRIEPGYFRARRSLSRLDAGRGNQQARSGTVRSS
jgi:hypothetical protein